MGLNILPRVERMFNRVVMIGSSELDSCIKRAGCICVPDDVALE